MLSPGLPVLEKLCLKPSWRDSFLPEGRPLFRPRAGRAGPDSAGRGCAGGEPRGERELQMAHPKKLHRMMPRFVPVFGTVKSLVTHHFVWTRQFRLKAKTDPIDLLLRKRNARNPLFFKGSADVPDSEIFGHGTDRPENSYTRVYAFYTCLPTVYLISYNSL